MDLPTDIELVLLALIGAEMVVLHVLRGRSETRRQRRIEQRIEHESRRVIDSMRPPPRRPDCRVCGCPWSQHVFKDTGGSYCLNCLDPNERAARCQGYKPPFEMPLIELTAGPGFSDSAGAVPCAACGTMALHCGAATFGLVGGPGCCARCSHD